MAPRFMGVFRRSVGALHVLFAASILIPAILFALAAYLTLASGRWDIDELIGTLLIGLMVAYCLVLLNAKRKTTAGPWS